MQRCTHQVLDWLKPTNRHPFIVVGPDGCGKSMLLHHCFDKVRSTGVRTIFCFFCEVKLSLQLKASPVYISLCFGLRAPAYTLGEKS